MGDFLSPREKRLLLEATVTSMSSRQRIETVERVYASLSRRQRLALWCRDPLLQIRWRLRARRWRRTWGA